MAKLIFGCGYLGRHVAQLWRSAGNDVLVVTRSDSKASALRALGLRAQVGDITDGDRFPEIADVETALFAVGYDRASQKSIHEVFVNGLRNALAVLPRSIRRLIYISSTGVYGQNRGEWLDEDSPTQPIRRGGRACQAAEQLLRSHPLGQQAIVLRLAGLYGPGRLPKLAAIQEGRALDVPEEGYLNLIHVDDAAGTILAAEAKAVPPCTYVVCDGQPVLRREFYRELARRLKCPLPEFRVPSPSAASAQRAISNKRLRNRKMLDDLGAVLQYPSYKEGLAALVEAEETGEAG